MAYRLSGRELSFFMTKALANCVSIETIKKHAVEKAKDAGLVEPVEVLIQAEMLKDTYKVTVRNAS